MTRRERLTKAAGPIARDLIGVGGLLLVVAGIAEWSHAAAMVTGGLLLAGGAYIWARKG